MPLILVLLALLYALVSMVRPALDPRWATLRHASEYSTLPVKTLRDWISRGRLPAYRFGPRQIRVNLNDLDALVRRIPTANGGKAS